MNNGTKDMGRDLTVPLAGRPPALGWDLPGRREFLASVAAVTVQACAGGDIVRSEVCIYGGTSGGVAAAVQASRLGRPAVIVEAGKHLGGMTAGGLSAVDIGNPRTVGGIAREYFDRLAQRYGRQLPWDRAMKGVPTGGAFAVEPHGAEELFNEFVRESNVPVFFESPLASVEKEGTRIRELVTADGRRFQAEVFIDCTYEGDLMSEAGVSYTVTRESNDEHDETLNGVMFHPRYEPKVEWGVAGPNGRRPDGKGLWDRDIPLDPYVSEGNPSSGLLPLVDAAAVGPEGSPAPGVQAYCYRLCLTRNPANRIPLEKPGGYDPGQYSLVARFIHACKAAGDQLDLRTFSKHDPIPSEKYDFNTATFGGNLPGASWAWSEAGPSGRASIGRDHEDYHRGLLHFLATDPAVPERVRAEMSAFGLCRDEFVDNDGWPHQIYVREGRRMVSDFVLTQHHCQGRALARYPVGLGSYGIDLHEIRRVVHDGIVWREGKGGGRVPRPYPIGYGCIVPKSRQVSNLFVTFALSATHVAFGSTRMEPPFMILSQSAAVAASLAIESGVDVQDVDYEALRGALVGAGQVIEWPAEEEASA